MNAISPAIERTKYFLFKPFRLGTFLKLALVASLAEAGSSGANFNVGNPFMGTGGKNSPKLPSHWPNLQTIHWPSPLVWVGIAVVIVLVLLPVSLLLSYLLIRLRFSFFDCVVSYRRTVAPGWHKYHRQSMRYLGLSVCVGGAFVALFAVMAFAFWLHYRTMIAGLIAGEKPDFFALLPVIAVVGLFIGLLALVGFVVDTALSYFVLPRMALDDAAIVPAVSAVWDDLKREPGQFVLFTVMRILLPMIAGIATFVVMIVPGIVLLILGMAVALLVTMVADSIPKPLAWGLAGLGALVAAVVVFVVSIAVGGTIGTFTRTYAAMFYAGRYGELARALWPSPPPPPVVLQPPPLIT